VKIEKESHLSEQAGNDQIALIHFGRKGAGLQLCKWICEFYKSSGGLALVSLSSYAKISESDKLLMGEVSYFKTFKSLGALILTPLRPFTVAKKLKNQVSEKEIQIVIFPMPHVWDLIIIHELRKLNLKIIFMIHDNQAHLGEIFPPSWYVKCLIAMSDEVIFFSSNVKDSLKAQSKRTYVCALPALVSDKVYGGFVKKNVGILFLGRIRKYKGISTLIDAYNLLPEPRLNLTIAGEGNLPVHDYSRVTVINRWLSDEEMIELLQGCEILVLPYVEATQSGLVPIAMNLNVKIVFSEVGGLSEQLSTYHRKVGFSGASPTRLSIAIQNAVDNKFDAVGFDQLPSLSSVLANLKSVKENL
jgi:glycosyltransferase involved in cell wall biosynthesis